MGWQVHVLPPDLDESGGTDRRAQLQVAVEGIESGRWEGLIVYDLSRFFRNTRLAIEYTDRIESVGGRVVSTVEQLPAGSLGTYLHTILSAGNQHFRDLKSEQFLSLQSKLVEDGKWRPPVIPPGYVKGEDGRLVIGPDAPKVKRAFKLRADGLSLPAIQKEFGWGQSVVARMLRNRVYLGEVSLGGNVNPKAHPPLVTRRAFAAVQQLNGARPNVSPSGSLLAGLIRCEACGYVMGYANKPSPRYACPKTRGKVPCPAPSTILAGRVEKIVSAVARAELSKLDVRSKRVGRSEADIEQKLIDAEQELAAFLSAVSAKDVGEVAFRAGARERREIVERARSDLAAASVVTPLAGITGTAADAWDRWDTHKRNLVLRGLLSCVVVRRTDGRQVPAIERVRVYPAGSITDFSRPLPFGDGHNELTLGIFRRED